MGKLFCYTQRTSCTLHRVGNDFFRPPSHGAELHDVQTYEDSQDSNDFLIKTVEINKDDVVRCYFLPNW